LVIVIVSDSDYRDPLLWVGLERPEREPLGIAMAMQWLDDPRSLNDPKDFRWM
jgi:hypothetical protein